MKRQGIPLHQALLFNALFSGASGAALLVQPGWWAGFFGVLDGPVYGVLGAGLLAFAALVAWAASNTGTRRRVVQLILIADLLWVAATPVVMLLGAALLRPAGQLLLLVVATVVGVIAAMQWRGLRVMRDAPAG